MSFEIVWFLMGMVALWGICYLGYRIGAYEDGTVAGGWFFMWTILLTSILYFGDGYLKSNGLDLDKLFSTNIVIEKKMEGSYEQDKTN